MSIRNYRFPRICSKSNSFTQSYRSGARLFPVMSVRCIKLFPSLSSHKRKWLLLVIKFAFHKFPNGSRKICIKKLKRKESSVSGQPIDERISRATSLHMLFLWYKLSILGHRSLSVPPKFVFDREYPNEFDRSNFHSTYLLCTRLFQLFHVTFSTYIYSHSGRICLSFHS